ncbi:hypothetical protein [uncultured Gimesia sp.]|uniref:hypothetical protein n=1 Tax=uncultured Gimesia sp. TaxID=1678688 RepID=UPI00260A4129|nr:hypothetical protein [uncultured Gimesia sp.]
MKMNLLLGLTSIIVICGLTILLTGELNGSLPKSPLMVDNKPENGTTDSRKDDSILRDANYNSTILDPDPTYKADTESTKSQNESKLDLSKSPKVDQNNRPSSKQYQAYLQALNSVPLPRGRLVIQVNSEAGVALANRYREQRRAAKRSPVRSFSSDVNNQSTNPRQTAMESAIASNNGKPSVTIPARVTDFTSARPSYASQSSTQTNTRSKTDRYYDPSYRPSVGHHYVNSHIRRDGTFVNGHFKTNSDDSFANNWSSFGNVNPHTGRIGTRRPPSNYSGGSTYVRGYYRSNGSFVSGHYRRK